MRDKLQYLTIGVLVGIVVMQWAIPVGQASIVDHVSAGGNVVAGATEGFAFSMSHASPEQQQAAKPLTTQIARSNNTDSYGVYMTRRLRTQIQASPAWVISRSAM